MSAFEIPTDTPEQSKDQGYPMFSTRLGENLPSDQSVSYAVVE